MSFGGVDVKTFSVSNMFLETEGKKVAGADSTSLEKSGSLGLDRSPLGQSLGPQDRPHEKLR